MVASNTTHERSEIWDSVLRQVVQSETITLDELSEFNRETVRDVLEKMDEYDWVTQLSETEWYIGTKAQQLRQQYST